jgi:putative MATE family efflux protein
MLAQFSQGLTNVVGTAMVASLDDTQALAGVGIGTYASLLTCFFVLGFSVAVQTLVARRIGQQRHQEVYEPLTAGIAIMLVSGLAITAAVFWLAPTLMAGFSDDPLVAKHAADYYRYRSFAVAALGINFCCRGFLSGSRKTAHDMRILVIVQLSNVLLCYLLIFGHWGFPELGAGGAGLAACLSIFIGTAIYIPVTFWQQWRHFFTVPQFTTIKTLIRLGLPNSSQQFFISLATLVLYWLLAQVGTEDLAIAHAINNIALLFILAGNGFGTAATTLVSQALGRNDKDDAYHWGIDCAITALPWLLLVSTPLLIWPETILTLFIPDNPILLERATVPLYLTSAIIVLRVLTRVFGQALLGAGDAKRVMISYALQQWGFFLPTAAAACLFFDVGISGIWLLQTISWGLQLAICLWLWQKRVWLRIQWL